METVKIQIGKQQFEIVHVGRTAENLWRVYHFIERQKTRVYTDVKLIEAFNYVISYPAATETQTQREPK